MMICLFDNLWNFFFVLEAKIFFSLLLFLPSFSSKRGVMTFAILPSPFDFLGFCSNFYVGSYRSFPKSLPH